MPRRAAFCFILNKYLIISHINVISRWIKLPFLNRSLEIPLFTDQNASVVRYQIKNSFRKLVLQIYLVLQFLSRFLLYFIIIINRSPPPPPLSARARHGDLAIFGAMAIFANLKKKMLCIGQPLVLNNVSMMSSVVSSILASMVS